MAEDARPETSGTHTVVEFDVIEAEGRIAKDLVAELSAGEVFDREWSVALLNLTLAGLKAEYGAAGKNRELEVLKPCLMQVRGNIDYSKVAQALGTSEGAARVAVHRLRKRFRQIYREEISQTLAQDADLEDEMRYLARVLGAVDLQDFS